MNNSKSDALQSILRCKLRLQELLSQWRGLGTLFAFNKYDIERYFADLSVDIITFDCYAAIRLRERIGNRTKASISPMRLLLRQFKTCRPVLSNDTVVRLADEEALALQSTVDLLQDMLVNAKANVNAELKHNAMQIAKQVEAFNRLPWYKRLWLAMMNDSSKTSKQIELLKTLCYD